MTDRQALPRRGNNNSSSAFPPPAPAESVWKGPRERDEDEMSVGGWWAFEGEAKKNGDHRGVEGTDGDAANVTDASKSKKELYEEAKNAGIEGRSAMNKAQLVEALQTHRATISSREPTTRQAPSPVRRTGAGRQFRPEGQPVPTEVDSAERLRQRDARRPERCVIVYRGSDRHGEFQVVVTGADGSHRSVARSQAFRAKAGEPRPTAAARAAHELVVERLVACGWWPAGSSEAWPEREFVRVRPAGWADDRSLVSVEREAGRARLVVEELDAYGNPTPLAASDAFRAPRLLPVRPSRQAKAALKRLLDHMEPDGWKVGEHVGNEWYAISLWRHRDTDGAQPTQTPHGGHLEGRTE